MYHNIAHKRSSQKLSGTYCPRRCAIGSDYNPSAGDKQHILTYRACTEHCWSVEWSTRVIWSD